MRDSPRNPPISRLQYVSYRISIITVTLSERPFLVQMSSAQEYAEKIAEAERQVEYLRASKKRATVALKSTSFPSHAIRQQEKWKSSEFEKALERLEKERENLRQFQRHLAKRSGTQEFASNKAPLPPQIQWHSKSGAEHLAAERYAAETKAGNQEAVLKEGATKRSLIDEDFMLASDFEPGRATKRQRVSSPSLCLIKEEKEK